MVTISQSPGSERLLAIHLQMSQIYIVTGCAGFIGSYLSTRLLESGERVVGIDEINDSPDVRMKRWRLDSLRHHTGFSLLQADIASSETVNGVAAKIHESGSTPAALINLAGRAGVQPSVSNPQLYLDANLAGTLNMMDLCLRIKVPKFVSASSSSVYGNSSVGPLSEESPTDSPLSPYAASKKAAEVLAHSYHHLHGLDVTMLRFFTVYGPAGRTDMSVLRFVRWIANGEPVVLYGDGSQERDFTYIGDTSRGILTALKPVGFETINLGSDSPVSLSALIEMIESAVGRKALIERHESIRADVKTTWANIAKARRVLNWEPRVSLEQGIKKTVDWYMANRELVDSLDLGIKRSGNSGIPDSGNRAAA